MHVKYIDKKRNMMGYDPSITSVREVRDDSPQRLLWDMRAHVPK